MKKMRAGKKDLLTGNTLSNKGFSLVELIIIIAIIALLVAIITPSLLQYIVKAKKAVDITTSESIAEVFNYSMMDQTEESNQLLYDYVSCQAGWAKRNREEYRVIAFLNVGYQQVNLQLSTTSGMDGFGVGGDKKQIVEEKLQDVVQGLRFLQFTQKIILDQWIICVNEKMELSVFVGGGVNNHTQHLSPYNGHHESKPGWDVYQIWPEVSEDYHRLRSTSQVRQHN
ncbi:MAG: prepilin-type N-terminal cleavage/methylation domain-containing protein [Lachnospiraceae bacterium]|nr:prepilin-type N-terminal cleavage/methylation domain-containing protein [Lachnospiraceae bacterium]